MNARKTSLIAALVAGALAVVLVAGFVGGVMGFAAAWVATPRLAARSLAAAPAVLTAPSSSARQPAVPATGSSAIPAGDEAVVNAVQVVKPAVVLITNGQGAGSGVIIDQKGYVLTNNHVVEGGRQFQVRFDNGATSTATLVGTYPTADLAVILVKDPVPAVARLGDSLNLKPGERVIAIGNALGRYTNSVTTGIVSATNRSLGGINGLIQHDASINSGNSGGPLLNLKGEVIGINSMVVRGQGTSAPAEGLGFSVPSAVARVVADKLIAGQSVDWPYMGVSLEGAPGGMRVASVEPNSGAAKAGVRQGDVIVSIEGFAVNPDTPVSALLLTYGVGATVKVDIQRDGQTQTVQVQLVKRPAGS